jgi:hypothetical protein
MECVGCAMARRHAPRRCRGTWRTDPSRAPRRSPPPGPRCSPQACAHPATRTGAHAATRATAPGACRAAHSLGGAWSRLLATHVSSSCTGASLDHSAMSKPPGAPYPSYRIPARSDTHARYGGPALAALTRPTARSPASVAAVMPCDCEGAQIISVVLLLLRSAHERETGRWGQGGAGDRPPLPSTRAHAAPTLDVLEVCATEEDRIVAGQRRAPAHRHACVSE